jgi:hypothetical protein
MWLWGGGALRIFIQPPHVWGSPEQVVLVAYKVLQNFEVSSARPGTIVGNQAVILVAKPHVARALAVLERAGMRAVRDSAFRSKELPRLQSVGRRKNDGQAGINERKRAVVRCIASKQMDLTFSFRPNPR